MNHKRRNNKKRVERPLRPGRSKQRPARNKQKKVSTLDPKLLIKSGATSSDIPYDSDRSFKDFPIAPQLKQNLTKKGFSKPSQIQDETFEALQAGRNLLGIANTGTGKTAAFLLPIIEQLLKGSGELTALVIVPTRELALQVEEEFKSLTLGMRLNVASFIGGTNIEKDLRQLRRSLHVVIGTPGRLNDLIQRKALKLHRIPVLVLDEFDRMLDMGFVNDIKRIVSGMKSRKQTMLFSATVDNTQKGLIADLLPNPVEVKVNPGTKASDRVDQDIITVPENANKFDMLLDLLSGEEFEKVLVFAETKRWVDRVSKKLNQSGVKADQIHGNKSQNYRVRALNRFKTGEVKVLVATDVAARGIDVSEVTHVINYQLPMSFDSYVHRIGRTGRAGKLGKALTFVN